MKCNEVKTQWAHHIKGDIDANLEQQIDEHLQTCEDCHRLLEKEAVVSQNQPVDRLLLRAKWKHQSKLIVLTIFTILSLYILSHIGSIVLYEIGDKTEKARRVEQSYFQLTNANLTLSPSFSTIEPLFKMNYDVVVEKKVGKESIYIADQQPSLRFNRYQNLNFSKTIDKTALQFANRTKNSSVNNSAWESLEKLPEGSVSELAVTWTSALTFKEVSEIVMPYDVTLVWAGIETEKLENLDDSLIPGINVVGLSMQAIQDDLLIYNELSKGNTPEDFNSIAAVEQLWRDTIIYLKDHNHYVKQLNNKMSLMDIQPELLLSYTDTHGIHLYGAVITGPTKELLKLKSNEHVYSAQIGQSTLWNW